MQLHQTTDTILMIRPVRFSYNTQTAESNAFQSFDASCEPDSIQEKAAQEFDNFVTILKSNGIDVVVVQDTLEPHTPDSIFPNNWGSYHADGTVFLYPMQAVNRRWERRRGILDLLREHFIIKNEIDLSHYEEDGLFLEGTGSMILDNPNRICYACISPRTDKKLLKIFGEKAHYEICDFESVDGNNKQIYHTNVVMCMAEKFVVICLDTVRNADEKQKLINKFSATNKEIVEISLEQMNKFAGNMLALKNNKEENLLVMSEQAYKALNAKQIAQIEKYSRIVHAPIYTIETNGGGSARCMMAEIFLPKKD
jgi:hypothetical protein